jgi:hypothetical protein
MLQKRARGRGLVVDGLKVSERSLKKMFVKAFFFFLPRWRLNFGVARAHRVAD